MDEAEFDISGGATDNVQIDYVEPAHAYLELQIVSPGQQEFRLPFLQQEIDLADQAAPAFSNGTSWVARLHGENVELVHKATAEKRPLIVGDNIQLDGAHLWLLDVRRPPLGTLHGVSAPFTGKVWNLTNQQTWVGRKGKRLNHIELNDSTISRTHATFIPDRHGHIELLAESAGAPTSVNGQPVETGQTERLSHGALIGFGKLMFRLSLASEHSSVGSMLTMNTLGTFQVKLGGDNLGAEIRNEKAQFLLAALAVKWGEPQSVDWLLAQFWPEVTQSRGRKNLSYTLVQLKENLRLEENEECPLFLRTTSSVQLNPDRLDAHDLVEVQRLTQRRQPITSRSALERLNSLYGGRFLPSCYDEWAEIVRQTLEVDFSTTLLRTAEYYLERGELEDLQIAAGKLLELDPQNEEAVRLVMEGALKTAQPEVAVQAYRSLEKSLKVDGLEPDTELVKLYYRANLGI